MHPHPPVSGTPRARALASCTRAAPNPGANLRRRLPGTPCARRRPRRVATHKVAVPRGGAASDDLVCVDSRRAQLVRARSRAAAALHLGLGRWLRSPGMTRRSSRSRCRRLLGSMPVSH